jgi:cephalosporin hydroxylase
VAQMPSPVAVTLNQPMRRYWFDRLAQHLEDWYAGVRISKFPEDLRVYEHLLWNSRAEVVIELGTQFGGSALWFRDRLAVQRRYGRARGAKVITVDIDVGPAREALDAAEPAWSESIMLIEGDLLDPDLPERVAREVPDDGRCMVVEDTAHVYETTRAALDGFHRFVPRGGFFVVEDGCVDVEEMRPSEDWPRGVLPAIEDWLATEAGSRFRIRRDFELYGLSCHPEGFLQRFRP